VKPLTHSFLGRGDTFQLLVVEMSKAMISASSSSSSAVSGRPKRARAVVEEDEEDSGLGLGSSGGSDPLKENSAPNMNRNSSQVNGKMNGTSKRSMYREELDGEEDHHREENHEDDDEDYEDVFGKRKLGKKGKKVAIGQSKKKSRSAMSEDVDLDAAADYDDNEEAVAGPKMESGHIVRIYVENFMCHRKMTVDFGRHVNFVTGENGSGTETFRTECAASCDFNCYFLFSGKSAIVVAVQLCLGGAARVTGRGQSLATLIREGSDGPAILRVTLHNVGADAYKPDIYGNLIIVERRIPKNGPASYKIQSATGEVIFRRV
jgi:hypothetical protein